MVTGNLPHEENTYFIDSNSGSETARLVLQDKIVTQGLGGLFPAHLDPGATRTVLDIACGPAGWALNVAFHHPHIQVMGVDVNPVMIEYARAEAGVQNLPNARFREMDVLQPLDLPTGSFDLVNGRFLAGFMPTTAWPTLVQECRRILRPGGSLLLTEGDAWSVAGSPALVKWSWMANQGMAKAGMSFAPVGNSVGLSPLLPRFLQRAGFRDVQLTPFALDFSVGTEAHEGYYQNFTVGSKLIQPFLVKMGIAAPEELEQLHQRLQIEMRSEDFYGHWFVVRVWGKTPGAVESQ